MINRLTVRSITKRDGFVRDGYGHGKSTLAAAQILVPNAAWYRRAPGSRWRGGLT